MLKVLLNALKMKYFIIFHYGSKKLGYIILKTICILIFIIPFLIYSVFNLIVDIVLLIPLYIPIIGIFARLICYIFDGINSLIFILLTFADIVFESENSKITEQLNNQGYLH